MNSFFHIYKKSFKQIIFFAKTLESNISEMIFYLFHISIFLPLSILYITLKKFYNIMILTQLSSFLLLF